MGSSASEDRTSPAGSTAGETWSDRYSRCVENSSLLRSQYLIYERAIDAVIKSLASCRGDQSYRDQTRHSLRLLLKAKTDSALVTQQARTPAAVSQDQQDIKRR